MIEAGHTVAALPKEQAATCESSYFVEIGTVTSIEDNKVPRDLVKKGAKIAIQPKGTYKLTPSLSKEL
jgi:hypothetical protein